MNEVSKDYTDYFSDYTYFPESGWVTIKDGRIHDFEKALYIESENCVCGSSAVGSDKHSNWCHLYSPF